MEDLVGSRTILSSHVSSDSVTVDNNWFSVSANETHYGLMRLQKQNDYTFIVLIQRNFWRSSFMSYLITIYIKGQIHARHLLIKNSEHDKSELLLLLLNFILLCHEIDRSNFKTDDLSISYISPPHHKFLTFRRLITYHEAP